MYVRRTYSIALTPTPCMLVDDSRKFMYFKFTNLEHTTGVCMSPMNA